MQTKQADLSTYHGLISDFFRQPTTEAEWEPYRLSQEQVAFFNAHGYLANIKCTVSLAAPVLWIESHFDYKPLS